MIKNGDEIRIWNGMIVVYVGAVVLSLNLPGETQENVIMIASNPPKICTSYP